MPALADIAAISGKQRQTWLILDPFGDDLQSQVMSHLDGGLHHDPVGLVGRHRLDEALIQLDFTDRQALQIAERRLTGPVVIDGNPDA